MAPPPRRVRRGVLALGVVAGLAVAVAAVVVSTGRDADDESPASPAARGDDADGELADALSTAGTTLEVAGTFSYEGTSRLEGPDPSSLDDSLVVDSDVTGDVLLPDAVRERVTGSDGITYEHITIGSDVEVQTWLRDTAYADQLDDRPWAEVEGGATGEPELSRLPEWLAGAIDPRDEGEDGDGNRVISAGVPPRLINDLGPDVMLIDVDLEATLDDDDAPVHVELVLSATDTIIEATYDIVRIGEDVEVVRAHRGRARRDPVGQRAGPGVVRGTAAPRAVPHSRRVGHGRRLRDPRPVRRPVPERHRRLHRPRRPGGPVPVDRRDGRRVHRPTRG